MKVNESPKVPFLETFFEKKFNISIQIPSSYESMLQDANFILKKRDNKWEYEYFDLSITVIH
jgi:hypothetical protein